MIGSFRNFAKTKFAGLLVFIMIIPFVFWGMGSMFSSGNSNNIVKINKRNITTQEFLDHINNSNISQKVIKENLNNNIIEELLSTLISTTLLDLEVQDFNFLISEKTLYEKIKTNKNFLDENGNFERIKYEKFLLENNQSAPSFELRLRGRELQKNLFDYIGGGTVSPKFLTKKLYEEENKKLDIRYINLDSFYKKKKILSEIEVQNFIDENEDQLKIEYLDFNYAIINPKNLIGVDEFNQTFFDKIDEIEIEISNNQDFETIIENFDLKSVNVQNFRYSSSSSNIEKKIFELKKIKFDLIENENDYILYRIDKSEQRRPDIGDDELKNEILDLILQKKRYQYNSELLSRIEQKEFNDAEFNEFGKNKIKSLTLNSIKDNKKFEINSVELLYSLPKNTFTLINDDKDNIYLAKIQDTKEQSIDINDKKFNEYKNKQNTNNKSSILKSYDLLLNKKYNVVLNKKTIERVKNFFQ